MTSNTHTDIFDIAAKLLKDHLYSEALSFLEQTDDSAPPRFLYARMRCLLKLGRTQEAAACCKALETVHADRHVTVLTQRLSSNGETPSPEVVAAMSVLCALENASRLFKQEDFEDALLQLDEEDGSSQPEWMYARARCLGKLARYDEALACCKALTEEHGDPRGAALAQKLELEREGLSAPVRRRIQTLTRELERSRQRELETVASLEAANADRESLRKELASREAALSEAERRCIDLETALRKAHFESQRAHSAESKGTATAPVPEPAAAQPDNRPLREKYDALRVGMAEKDLVALMGRPNRVGNMDDLLRDGLPPPPSLALSGNVKDMVAHFKATEVWTYESPDGAVKLDVTGGQITRIHPLIRRS